MAKRSILPIYGAQHPCLSGYAVIFENRGIEYES